MKSEYEKKMFAGLGVNRDYYYNFIVPMILKIKGKKCEKCGNTNNLDLHHSSTELINIHTLKLLCRKCHVNLHRTNHSHHRGVETLERSPYDANHSHGSKSSIEGMEAPSASMAKHGGKK